MNYKAVVISPLGDFDIKIFSIFFSHGSKIYLENREVNGLYILNVFEYEL